MALPYYFPLPPVRSQLWMGAVWLGMALTPCILRTTLAADELRFNRDIRPILSEYCFACHGFDQSQREAGLRLDTEAGAKATLDSGKNAIVPKSPETSELLRRIFSEDEDEKMPPAEGGKSLSQDQKAKLKLWIEQGAAYEPHWAFSPIERPRLPKFEGSSDTSHPIDLFVREQLLQVGLAPSPRAPAHTLLRRASFDLIGLPPTVDEVNAFEKDYAQRGIQAYQDAVDRYLERPAFGERWGRWWLDQARYADSNGYSIDAPREIWKYRDWVIESLNDNLPFDQFTIEQLAGDLLPDASQSQRIATGFHRNTQINQEGGIDQEQFRIESVFDRVATTGTVFLGLSVGCAQCHNHKFDPISQKEYYEIFAFFNNQDEPTMKVYGKEENLPELKEKLKEAEKALQTYIAEKKQAYQTWESKLTDEEKKKMAPNLRKALETEPEKRNQTQIRELFNVEVGKVDSQFQSLLENYTSLDNRLNGVATTMVLQERKEPRQTRVFVKGDFTRPAETVTPGVLSVLHPLAAQEKEPNRLDLARWIVSKANPLTARVIVNRLWQQYFGRGIVETENDFGLQGALPTHPELLDWLASEFMDSGWNFKQIHRQIVLSETYMQKSDDREDVREKDQDNQWLARQQRLRLDAELIRDAGLAVSGLLTSQLGGPPVFPPIPDGVMSQGQVKRQWKTSTGEDRFRRGIYTFVYRATPPPSLSVFDAPEGNSTCTRRVRSNTPLQALTLLNDAAFFEFATALKKIVESEGLEKAFLRSTSRKPTEEEKEILASMDALSVARVLLNLDETVTRE